MSLTRSPCKLKPGSTLTGSQPDLPTCVKQSLDQQVMRKRKQPDCHDYGQELATFRKEIMSFLHDFKRTSSDDIMSVQTNVSEIKSQLIEIKTTTDSLVTDQKEIKNEVLSLSQSLDFFSKRQEDLEQRVDSLSADVSRMSSLDITVAVLKDQVTKLQNEQYVTQQRDRLNNIEIIGIPEKSNENVIQYILSIASLVGVPLNDSDIIHIHRVPTRISGKPKNIVVKLNSLYLKDSIISAVRKRKGITTSDLGLNGTVTNVYINEHLIPYYKMLQKEVKAAAVKAGYAYVWIRNCKIYVRKDNNSPSFIIKDSMDLQKIK